MRSKSFSFITKVTSTSFLVFLLRPPPPSPPPPHPPHFPKQHVSDTCNIQVADVSVGNQRQDLSLLTLSVACPLFLWSFYYRTIIGFISAAHHTVHFELFNHARLRTAFLYITFWLVSLWSLIMYVIKALGIMATLSACRENNTAHQMLCYPNYG